MIRDETHTTIECTTDGGTVTVSIVPAWPIVVLHAYDCPDIETFVWLTCRAWWAWHLTRHTGTRVECATCTETTP